VHQSSCYRPVCSFGGTSSVAMKGRYLLQEHLCSPFTSHHTYTDFLKDAAAIFPLMSRAHCFSRIEPLLHDQCIFLRLAVNNPHSVRPSASCRGLQGRSQFLSIFRHGSIEIWAISTVSISIQQIQRSGFDSRCHQISWEAVGLERGPLSLVSTSEELLGRKSSGSGLENREYGHRKPSRSPRGTLYPKTLALTSWTRGGRPVGIVRSRTTATEYIIYYHLSLV
jgi:hypothetical protein